MADNNNILNEAETASENDNLDNNLTNEDYNGTTDNKESQYVPDIDVFSTDKVNSYVKLSDKYEDKIFCQNAIVEGLFFNFVLNVCSSNQCRNFMVVLLCNGWCFYYFCNSRNCFFYAC
ncbi:MAG: hypothetical protein ACLR1A_05745 [Eubacterium ventriosum]